MRKSMLIAAGTLLLVSVAVADTTTDADKQAEREKLLAEIRELVEPKTIPGGKSLQDIFGMWFAKVDQTPDYGLSLRLMRGGTQHVKTHAPSGKQGWNYIGGGNTVTIAPGASETISDVCIPLEIGVDKELFPVDGCAWLTNSSHTVYVRMQQYNEFKPVTICDEYVISLDLKKAYSLEKKQDVDYPFPFVNPRPDISQEEWELQSALPGYIRHINRTTKEYQDACSPIVPGVRKVLGPKKIDGIEKTEYIVFEKDCKSLSCVKYFPGDEDEMAEANLRKYDHEGGLYVVARVDHIGALGVCDVISKDRFTKNNDESFKRAFAREVLTRLNLTAADLPGINLDAILGEPEAKK